MPSGFCGRVETGPRRRVWKLPGARSCSKSSPARPRTDFCRSWRIFRRRWRAQIFIARDHYRETFGRDPRGIWLPECAYTSALDKVLQEANLRWFVIDSHGIMFGHPRPRYAIYAPVFTPAGPAAFGRDRESSRQVWSAEEGYPGDPAYRDFYRDIGFDLSIEYLRGSLPADGTRKFTGFKYHRITGRTPEKDLYHRDWAMAAVDSHAGHFMGARAAQIQHLRAEHECAAHRGEPV